MLARSVATLATLLATAARELDPAACAARFDVQRDKIIRTEESRDMGARYLSELDVGARHECRRLCCETDACDVFVFEEKSPGSCYLFNCGPPEDFRCKFTAHSNFSSGVLALSRRLAELQDQERLQPPAAPPPRLAPAPVSTRAPTPAPTRAATAAPSPAAPAATRSTQAPHGRCSRYQWECHSGGECIAVYNACDGVAQCADGSDEAPELGCPAAAPPAPPQAPPAAPPHVPPAHSPRPEPPPALPMYPAQEPGAGRWPHRLLQAQPPRDNNEVEGEPHIFSHKGGLLQAEAEPPAFEPPPAAWPRRAWPQHTAGVESGWGGWSRGGEWDARRAWPPPEPELPPYLAGKTMPELALLYPASHALRDAAKKAPPAPAASPAPAPPPPRTPPPPHATHENTTKKKAAAVQSEVAAAPTSSAVGGGANAHIHMHATNTAQAQRDERDGLSEHPPSAVLLLILGVAMTGALGVLLAVRARAARRRRGGRGRGLAHDADYLVNGMYL